MKKLVLIVFIVIVSILFIYYIGNIYSKVNRKMVIANGYIFNDIEVHKVKTCDAKIYEESIEVKNDISKNENISKNNETSEQVKKNTITKDEKSEYTNVEQIKKNENKIENTIDKENNITNEELKKQEEKCIINYEMIEKIKNIIINNESEDMKRYGYSVIVDSSITNITNQFTFSEKRVIDKITLKFGTIRIYAFDYYEMEQFICTKCFII